MERVQQLRQMMKTQGQSLTATKDRVKQLKAQKLAQTSAPVRKGSVATSANAARAVPANFFDDAPSPIPADAATHNPSTTASHSTVRTLPSSVPIASKSVDLTSALPAPSLPAGFFDDPLADSKARGVDLQALSREVDAQHRTQVDDFLQEISHAAAQIPELQSDPTAEDDAAAEAEAAPWTGTGVNTALESGVGSSAAPSGPGLDEDAAVQMAYLAGYARLLRRSGQLAGTTDEASQQTLQELDAVIAEGAGLRQQLASGEVGGLELGEAALTRSLLQTRQQRKRHLYTAAAAPVAALTVVNGATVSARDISPARKRGKDSPLPANTDENGDDVDDKDVDEDPGDDGVEYSPLDFL